MKKNEQLQEEVNYHLSHQFVLLNRNNPTMVQISPTPRQINTITITSDSDSAMKPPLFYLA